MFTDNFPSRNSSVDAQIQEPFLKSNPVLLSESARWSIAAVAATPLAMAAGYIATAEAANGAYALPFIAIGAYKIIRECLGA